MERSLHTLLWAWALPGMYVVKFCLWFSCWCAQEVCLDAALEIKIPKCLSCLLPWAVLDPCIIASQMESAVTMTLLHGLSAWPLQASPVEDQPWPSSCFLLHVHLQLQPALCSTSFAFFSPLLPVWFVASLTFQWSFSAACSCCSFLLALQFQSCSLRARHALQHVDASANFTWRWTKAQMLLAAAGNNSSWNVLFKGLTDN